MALFADSMFISCGVDGTGGGAPFSRASRLSIKWKKLRERLNWSLLEMTVTLSQIPNRGL